MHQSDVRLVIFDCDGVLVGGEDIANGYMAEEARKYGWNLSKEDAVREFSGWELSAIGDRIAEASGKKLPDDWAVMMERRIADAMRHRAQPVPGAEKMLADVKGMGLPMRVGTNSSVAEMEAKFAATGLDAAIPLSRVHSARALGVPKPNPDVYLAAAKAEGVLPDECVVVEDSDAGVEAARRAGMTCVLLRDPAKKAPHFPSLHRIAHLDELVPLLRRMRASEFE